MHQLDRDLGTCRVLAPGEGREIASGELVLRVKVESAETGAAFALAEYVIPVGAWEGLAPHRHRSASETVYVLDGTLEITAGARTLRAGPGACLHIPAGSIHAISNPGPSPVRFLQVVSPGSLLTMIEDISALGEARVQDRSGIAAVFRLHDTEIVG